MIGAMVSASMGAIAHAMPVSKGGLFGQDGFGPLSATGPRPPRMQAVLGAARSPGGRAHKRWKTRRASGRA